MNNRANDCLSKLMSYSYNCSLILLIGTLREKRILTMLAIKAMLIGVYLANSISGWKSQIGSSS